ncbi:MAG: pyridoxal phosphate-dependent aminotransferase, partial [Pseudomonadota bacterium]
PVIPLSQRMHRTGGSATAAAMARAAAAKAAGRPVISLTTGEPDGPTPAHIRAAAIAAIEAGDTRYTAVDGTPRLKAAIAARAEQSGITARPDEIIASTGAKQCIYNALLAVIGSDDEVIIPIPAWVSYIDIVRLAGGRPVLVPGRAEAGFRPDIAEILAAITPKTRAILLNSPSNPTGAVLPAGALETLAAGLRPDILLIADDIYEHIVYDGVAHATPAARRPDLRDQILTVNGVSKAYAMTGWRLGYAIGPQHLIAAMRTLQSQSTTNPSSISQAAAIAALEGGLETVVAQTETLRRRRDRLLDALSHAPALGLLRPEGAFYLWIDVSGLIGGRFDSEAAVVDALLEEANLGVVGGAGFGLSPYIRLSFAAADSLLDEAAERLVRFAATA